jgi:F-type H+-transporting ATPase subunit b
MSFTTVLAQGAVLASEEPPNPLLPKTPELIVGAIAFLLLYWVLRKYAYPMFEKTFEERTAAIEGGIKKAEEAQREASAALEQYQAQLADARGEASTIRSEAQADRTRIVEEARVEAAAAAELVTSRAAAQMEADRLAAKAELSQEVGRIALELAGRVVGEVLTDDARARATVDRFIAELETSSSAAGEGAS